MKKSTQLIATAIFAGVTIFGSGCAVVRSQESKRRIHRRHDDHHANRAPHGKRHACRRSSH